MSELSAALTTVCRWRLVVWWRWTWQPQNYNKTITYDKQTHCHTTAAVRNTEQSLSRVCVCVCVCVCVHVCERLIHYIHLISSIHTMLNKHEIWLVSSQSGWPQSRRKKFPEVSRLLQSHKLTFPQVIATKSKCNNDLHQGSWWSCLPSQQLFYTK